MPEEFSFAQPLDASQPGKKLAHPSSDKSVRTMLLAVLFQVSWPTRLTRDEIIQQLPMYGEHPNRALYRDIETLTGIQVENLPEPAAEELDVWCAEQQKRKRLALTYERLTKTFGLAQSLLSLDINEDEARAFVALQEGFGPGTPYAEAVQHLLKRWEWLFTEKSHRLVQQKRKRHARPVLLPLSPVVDYSQHGETILLLDQALEEGAYVSFAYTPLMQSWDAEPMLHEHTEPYELEYRDGHWYYTAYIRDLNTFIDYRVDRIRPGTLRKCRLTQKFAKTGRYASEEENGEDMRQQKRTLIIVLLHPFHVGIYTSPCSTRCDIVYEDSFLKTLLLKGRNDGRSNEA